MRTYEVISGDGHTEVPAEMWTSRVPAKHRDLAPRLVIKDNGNTAWRMADFEKENWGNLVGELAYDETVQGCWTYHFPDGTPRPGTGDGAQRLREQDQDGLDAEVLFPPVHGPKFLRLMIAKDQAAYESFIRAYNDWLALEYCAVAPDRLIGNALVPETGVDEAIAEMTRAKKMGLPGVYIGMWPNGGATPDPDDDRFWAAALDLDMKIAPHFTFGGPWPVDEMGMPVDNKLRVFAQGSEHASAKNVVNMIVNGVFDRYPDLKIYFAETGCSWLPSALNSLDEFYSRWYTYWDVRLKMLPSDYFRQHCIFNFIDDRLAMQFRYYIGLDMMTWGTDFPHSVGTFPHSREILEDLFEGVPPNERRQILVGNVCRFYDLDPDKPLTPTPTPSLVR
jgi:uncharacterized protein